MTNLRKALSAFVSLCFLAALAVMPLPFFLWENIYRQLPLYCFLEEAAAYSPLAEDRETYEKIVSANGAYLGERALMEQENGRQKQGKSEKAEKAGQAGKAAGKTKRAEPTGKPELTDKPEPADRPEPTEAAETAALPKPVMDLSPERLESFDYLMGNFFIVDSATGTSPEQINAARFLSKDFSLQESSGNNMETSPQTKASPQIVIYHTHGTEAFADSRAGREEDTIVGVGNVLEKLLTEKYGYRVAHIKEAFDMAGGELDRSAAYDYAGEYLRKFLGENPGVEVLIDLHRDGVPENRHLVTRLNGKNTAQIMFYNGLSYTEKQGALGYLPNPYIEDNLAFSFQLEYQAARFFPDFSRGIYLAGYRYNLHLRPRSLLLEAGAQTNTVREVKNAMELFAELLDKVLSGKGQRKSAAVNGRSSNEKAP